MTIFDIFNVWMAAMFLASVVVISCCGFRKKHKKAMMVKKTNTLSLATVPVCHGFHTDTFLLANIGRQSYVLSQEALRSIVSSTTIPALLHELADPRRDQSCFPLNFQSLDQTVKHTRGVQNMDAASASLLQAHSYVLDQTSVDSNQLGNSNGNHLDIPVSTNEEGLTSLSPATVEVTRAGLDASVEGHSVMGHGCTVSGNTSPVEAIPGDDGAVSDVGSNATVVVHSEDDDVVDSELATQLRLRTEQVETIVKEFEDNLADIQSTLLTFGQSREARITHVEEQGRSDRQRMADVHFTFKMEMNATIDQLNTDKKKMMDDLTALKKSQEKFEKESKEVDTSSLDKTEVAMLEHAAVTAVRTFTTRNGWVYCAVDLERGARVSGDQLKRYAASKLAASEMPLGFFYKRGLVQGQDRTELAMECLKPMVGRARVYNKKRRLITPIRSWIRNTWRNRRSA